MTHWRAVLRPNRFELASLVALAVITILITGGTAARLLAFGIPAACFRAPTSTTAACVAQGHLIGAYLDTAATWTLPSFAVVVLLPVLAAVVFGVSLVGKEIDQRTTILAWSLSPSRRRWLLLRLVPVCLSLLVFSLVDGWLGDVLEGLRQPMIDQERNFEGLGVRGVAIAGTGLLAFGIALLSGALLGRLLPALLVSGALITGAYLGTSVLTDGLLLGESVVAESGATDGGREIESLIITPEGELIGWDEAYARYGADVDQIGTEESPFRIVFRVVPGEVYPLAAARLAVLQGAIGLVAIGLGFVVVDRRRP